MGYVFGSIFAGEINNYLKLTSEAGRYVGKIKSSLKSFDIYLFRHHIKDKALTESLVQAWLDEKNVKPRTKAGILDNVGGFAKYLTSVGYYACLPEPPIVHQDYIPYIFSSEELENIFRVADNHQARPNSRFTETQFPIVLRVLYGCGIRLREALTMVWKEVDLDSGIIAIRKAKNQKQRLVPISKSLKIVLALYRRYTMSNGICPEYVFESQMRPGNPYDNSTFWRWFSKTLNMAGINFTRRTTHERGPCPHCLRHQFVVHSFMKSEAEGRNMENTVPFLSAYLGHEGILETQEYLRASYILYTQSHQRINAYTDGMFPEVDFE